MNEWMKYHWNEMNECRMDRMNGHQNVEQREWTDWLPELNEQTTEWMNDDNKYFRRRLNEETNKLFRNRMNGMSQWSNEWMNRLMNRLNRMKQKWK